MKKTKPFPVTKRQDIIAWAGSAAGFYPPSAAHKLQPHAISTCAKHRKNFSLCIEPCMGRIVRAQQGGFIELRNLVRIFGPRSGLPALVAHRFQLARSRTIQSFVAQWLACTTSFPDAEFTIAPQLLLRAKPVWGLNERTKHMRAHLPDARYTPDLCNFSITLSQLNHNRFRLLQ